MKESFIFFAQNYVAEKSLCKDTWIFQIDYFIVNVAIRLFTSIKQQRGASTNDFHWNFPRYNKPTYFNHFLMKNRSLIVLLFLGILALSNQSAFAVEDHLTVQLKWHHQFQFAGLYAAIEKGYFAEVGLKVSLLEGKEGIDPAEVVVSGQADYGIGTSELVVSRANGMPIVVMAAVYQHSPYGIAVLNKSGIEHVHDLEGKRMMIEPQAAEITAYLQQEGVDVSTITMLPHSFKLSTLLSGEVDAMSIYQTDEIYTLTQANVDYSVFTARSGGIDFYGDVLFTTEAEVEQNPKRAKLFLSAFKKGWKYALDHPEEIIQLIHEKYNRDKNIEHLRYEAKQSLRFIIPKLVEFGYVYEGRWRHIANVYAGLGVIKPEIDLEDFVYVEAPAADYKMLLMVIAPILLIILIIGTIGMRFYLLNKRLNREISWRTAAQEKLKVVLHQERNILAILAHDFRTPVAVISAACQLMKISAVKDNALGQREVNKILSASQRINALIDSCLNKDQFDSIDKEQNFSPIHFNLFLEQLLQENRVLHFQRIFELTQSDEEYSISGNQHLLSIAISNLLENAVKYSPVDGRIFLATSVENNQLKLTVVDEGPAIKQEEREHIFEKYYRSPTTRNIPGAGIGLFAVREILETHGGTVAYSTCCPGNGFVITLPVCSSKSKG